MSLIKTQNGKSRGRDLENARENISKLDEKLNKHSEVLVALEKNSMSAKEAHDMFVSKELFRQMEKHIDARFDGIDTNLGKILEYLNKGKIWKNGIKSRTIWLNIATAIFGVLMSMETEVKQVVSLFIEPSGIWIFLGVINVLLRLDTFKEVK